MALLSMYLTLNAGLGAASAAFWAGSAGASDLPQAASRRADKRIGKAFIGYSLF